MKKIVSTILAASMMLLGTNAFAQLSIGAGYLNSKTTLKVSLAGIASAKPDATLNGFFVGGAYNIPIGESGLGVEPGVYFSYQGANDVQLFKVAGYELKLDRMSESYLAVPINVNFKIALTDGIKGLIYAGPTFSYGLTSKIEVGDTKYDIYSGDLKSGDYETGSDYLKDLADYKRFDVLLGGGVGVEFFNQFRFKVGYDFGLLDRGPSNVEIKRNQLTVGVAYLF